MKNQCPYCKSEGSLILKVDAMDTNYPENSPEWDTHEIFELTRNLIVKDHMLPHGVVVCDKDRILCCNQCGAQSESVHPEMDKIRNFAKSKNEGWF